ncbi:outer membrane beta-barrel protein [Psychroflexus tropicus]|uniref:outer membrane beta-barrel protein n=1 Tax=Psychroflexus tropicus TaxID=197345 RepID=UPI0003633C68|nr:outer membrane beta-barrel protein [Psychroflexus tropicus]
MKFSSVLSHFINLRYILWICFIQFPLTFSIQAQSPGVFENEKWLVESQTGLSFSWADLALADNSLTLEQEATFENAFKAELNLGINYSLAKNLLAGFNAGVGYLSYDTQQTGLANTFTNYQFGPYLRYYIPLNGLFALFAQSGVDQNFLTSNRYSNTSYFDAYLDLGFNMKLKSKWWISLRFTNLASYYSDDFNFEDRDGFEISNPLKNFIDFPVFGVLYQLD